MLRTSPPALPRRRRDPLNPPEEYRLLREREPVSRISFPDGKAGWLVTRYEDARAVLADPRFSASRVRASSPVRTFPARPGDTPERAGSFFGMDAPEHTRYRRALARWFTARRMRALAPRIERIVADHLDTMERAGPPADLVPAFALPIPSLVICELLGVPYEDRALFQRRTADLLKVTVDEDTALAARDALFDYIGALVAAKRRAPDGGLLAGLVHDTGPGAAFSTEELSGIGLLLLVAGHETTANMLALGTYTLLRHPGQLRALRNRTALFDGAIEELLRYLGVVQFGTTRVAREDVPVGGRLVRAGETVVVALPAADRDPDRYPAPERLDVTRAPGQHLAFGHGFHQCLGQQLARTEMRVAFPALFRRFPALRLAVPDGAIRFRDDMLVYGVHRLPVAW